MGYHFTEDSLKRAGEVERYNSESAKATRKATMAAIKEAIASGKVWEGNDELYSMTRAEAERRIADIERSYTLTQKVRDLYLSTRLERLAWVVRHAKL